PYVFLGCTDGAPVLCTREWLDAELPKWYHSGIKQAGVSDGNDSATPRRAGDERPAVRSGAWYFSQRLVGGCAARVLGRETARAANGGDCAVGARCEGGNNNEAEAVSDALRGELVSGERGARGAGACGVAEGGGVGRVLRVAP